MQYSAKLPKSYHLPCKIVSVWQFGSADRTICVLQRKESIFEIKSTLPLMYIAFKPI